jgi:hypothetical protein
MLIRAETDFRFTALERESRPIGRFSQRVFWLLLVGVLSEVVMGTGPSSRQRIGAAAGH